MQKESLACYKSATYVQGVRRKVGHESRFGYGHAHVHAVRDMREEELHARLVSHVGVPSWIKHCFEGEDGCSDLERVKRERVARHGS